MYRFFKKLFKHAPVPPSSNINKNLYGRNLVAETNRQTQQKDTHETELDLTQIQNQKILLRHNKYNL